MKLVSLFQERLSVSKIDARWRVAGLFVIAISCLAFSALLLYTFPFRSGFTETVWFLPENHVQVVKILDGDVLVGRDQFLGMAEGNTTFVSVQRDAVVYMTKVGNVSYRYEEKRSTYPGYDVDSFRIENGAVAIEMKRIVRYAIGSTIILILAIVISFMLFILVQSKRVSGFGSTAKYCEVWI